MKKSKYSELKLSLHAFDRINERIKPINDFDAAERFAKEEIEESNVTVPEILENGERKITYICTNKKFIVINNLIITVIPI
ncbi:hypothetical protein [Bacillus sp. MRMR6]|uniref:hypothetical protein n=1 Tax=Bacillus sp. MRMR6 TaxID=1928617 RepID=UPI000951BBB7|nr:hypothetical protein [Bacillus sp. MRMR6]OLS38591.1 hypothetical protein BTR25_14330 [Bacillus sp. MRMR6]